MRKFSRLYTPRMQNITFLQQFYYFFHLSGNRTNNLCRKKNNTQINKKNILGSFTRTSAAAACLHRFYYIIRIQYYFERVYRRVRQPRRVGDLTAETRQVGSLSATATTHRPVKHGKLLLYWLTKN